jgi:hypothetical protein
MQCYIKQPGLGRSDGHKMLVKYCVTIGEQSDYSAPHSARRNRRDINSARTKRHGIPGMKLFAAEISGPIAMIPIAGDKRNITNQAKWSRTQFYVPRYVYRQR